MFIKFSDKTKKIIVKNSKKDDDSEDVECIYLDEEDGDRRVNVLNKHISDESDNSKEDNQDILKIYTKSNF
tara:strand:+ start:354 stop:566 length:213 start_codon:yes stop_codon:yes gene_type:complete